MKFEVKRTIKLPQMLAAVEEDKKNKKVSFILDKTGILYNLLKEMLLLSLNIREPLLMCQI